MKKTIWFRPYGWMAPLAILAGAGLARFSGWPVDGFGWMLAAYVFSSVLTLGCFHALRLAQARLTSRRRVAGNAVTAVLMCLVGMGILIFVDRNADALGWVRENGFQDLLEYMIMMSLVPAVRVMEEFFHATGDDVSAAITDVLLALVIVLVPLFSAERGIMMAALGAVFAVALVIALLGAKWSTDGAVSVAWIGERPAQSKPVRPAHDVILYCSQGVLRAGLYPALAYAFGAFTGVWSSMEFLMCVACGMALIELFSTDLRRDVRENPPFLTALPLIVTALVLLGLLENPDGSAGCVWMLAGAVSVLMYAGFAVRPVLMGVVLAAPSVLALVMAHGMIVKLVCCGAAVLLSIPEWLELARGMRAGRIRRKAMKRAKQMRKA